MCSPPRSRFDRSIDVGAQGARHPAGRCSEARSEQIVIGMGGLRIEPGRRIVEDVRHPLERFGPLQRKARILGEVDGDAERRLGAALAPPDLQQPQRPVLDGELDVDQIGQVPLQQRRRLVELVGDVGPQGPQLAHRECLVGAGDDVLTLGSHQEIADQSGCARGGVARECDTRARAPSQVAERHHLDGRSGAERLADALDLPVDDGPVRVPRLEHGGDRSGHLLTRIRRDLESLVGQQRSHAARRRRHGSRTEFRGPRPRPGTRSRSSEPAPPAPPARWSSTTARTDGRCPNRTTRRPSPRPAHEPPRRSSRR